jgi:hypothetical protein
MKRKWQVQRSTVERMDGQRRWDCAYQCLLRWADQAASRSSEHSLQFAQQEVESDESRHLCSGLDIASTENADH